MINAAIYARYSTDNQNPDTIEVQVKKCAEYAAAHNMRIVDVYADEATSGMKSHRPELDRFFRDTKIGLFKAVLIYDQSRFSRDLVDWFSFRRLLQANKINLISVTQSFIGGDINDPSVFASEGINALINQMHVLQTRQKVKAKMNFLAQQALHTGGVAPLGYNVIDKKYHINETEADVVRAVFHMYAYGSSYNEIIDQMNRVGAKTKRGSSFGKNSIHDLLCNERYIGTYVYGKVPRDDNGKRNTHAEDVECIKIPDAIPRIVSDELWEKVRKRMADNKRNAANTAKVKYMLSGKIFCGHCGAAMVGVNNRSKYFYYGCNANQRLRTCDKKLVPKDAIEELVVSHVRELIRPDNVHVHAAYIARSIEKAKDAGQPDKAALRAELQNVKDKIKAINEAIANRIYSSSTVDTLKDLEKQASNIEVILYEISLTERAMNKYSEPEIASILLFALEQSDRDLVGMFVERVECFDDGGVKITFNPLGIDVSKRPPLDISNAIAYTPTALYGSAAPERSSSKP
ncbi:recombinase family protein [Oscillospiraceae bacterium LTW-04]|nr:recombinase family protein [Oscillospiraceae bacterium MB24-C1]